MTIRPYAPPDAPRLYAAAQESVETVGRWLPWCHSGYQLADAKAWITEAPMHWDTGLDYRFGVFDTQTHELLGGVGVNRIVREHAIGNLGYWVSRNSVGKGVATMAATLAARFGLTEGRLERLEIVIPIGNTASQRVAEKLSAHFEGIARHRLVVRRQSVDSWQYSLTCDDLSRLQA